MSLLIFSFLDLCPLDHIDLDNSTVTVSLSTRSMEEVEVSVMVRIKGKGGDFAQTEDVKYVDYDVMDDNDLRWVSVAHHSQPTPAYSQLIPKYASLTPG